MPRLPTNEKGAKLAKFFNRQRGNKTPVVTAISVGTFVVAKPAVVKRLTHVSPKIME